MKLASILNDLLTRAEQEGHTCAKALGWGSYRLDWSKSGRYLTVEEEGGLL